MFEMLISSLFPVPTNYRIKTKLASGSKDDEDKNLGPWVNRQRSLYSAGKLRKDRQKVRLYVCHCDKEYNCHHTHSSFEGSGRRWTKMVHAGHDVMGVHVRNPLRIRRVQSKSTALLQKLVHFCLMEVTSTVAHDRQKLARNGTVTYQRTTRPTTAHPGRSVDGSIASAPRMERIN
jgi:hypothetical protein